MKKITFRSYKTNPHFLLNQLAHFFQINKYLKWKSYLVIQGQSLDNILKYHSEVKQVYIFQFGCITFVNFEEEEVSLFLEYFSSLVGEIDFSNLLTDAESYSLYLDQQQSFVLDEMKKERIPFQSYHSALFASILAKSSALNKIEREINVLFDEVEYFVKQLEKGRLVIRTTQFRAILAKILRFEYDMMYGIRIFDRDVQNQQYSLSKAIYDELAKEYELEDRFQGIQSKIKDLRAIIKEYSTLSYRVVSNRNLWLEIFLLGLFPLTHILHVFSKSYDVFKWLPSFFHL